jgi:hypothetical protein
VVGSRGSFCPYHRWWSARLDPGNRLVDPIERPGKAAITIPHLGVDRGVLAVVGGDAQAKAAQCQQAGVRPGRARARIVITHGVQKNSIIVSILLTAARAIAGALVRRRTAGLTLLAANHGVGRSPMAHAGHAARPRPSGGRCAAAARLPETSRREALNSLWRSSRCRTKSITQLCWR